MLEVNTVIGDRYKILSLIARGGMGYVYLAESLSNSSFKVALKVLDPERLQNPHDREIFRNELIAAYRVSHLNVVTVFEYFDTPDFQAFALEYLNGGDLLERMQGDPHEVKDVLRWLREASSGLYAIHRSGTIHRDMKPENLLFNSEGTLKITDFGIAAIRGSKIKEKPGILAGTHKYLSPEYVERGVFDQRSDIYALGVLGFELFSGKSPFIATEGDELLKERLLDRGNNLCEILPQIPAEVGELVTRMMARVPQERFYDALEVSKTITKVEEKLGFLNPKKELLPRVSILETLQTENKNHSSPKVHQKSLNPINTEPRAMKRVSSLELVAMGLLAALVVAVAFPMIWGGN